MQLDKKLNIQGITGNYTFRWNLNFEHVSIIAADQRNIDPQTVTLNINIQIFIGLQLRAEVFKNRVVNL